MDQQIVTGKEEIITTTSNTSYGNLALAITAISVLSFTIFRQLTKHPKRSQHQNMATSETTASAERLITEAELNKAKGEDDQPIYVGVKDPFGDKVTIFDVTSAKQFYGPGGPYHVFAGKNATHGLATSTTDADKVTGDLSNLTESQKDTHMQWHAKYSSKYPVVGYLASDEEITTEETESIVTGNTEAKKDV